MKILINYSTENFYLSQKLLNKSASKYFDKIISYNKKKIEKTDFYKKNKNILDNKRGSGFWCWKPYIILDSLSKISENDILMYCDSGSLILDSPKFLFDLCKNRNLVIFSNGGYKQSMWTKRDCFVYTNGDNEKFHNAQHGLAGYNLWRKTKFTINFLQEWLRYCCNINIISDKENICGLPNLKNFIEHRHDQSILTQLVTKYNIETFRNPSQYGRVQMMENLKNKDIDFFKNLQVDTDPRSCPKILNNSNYNTIIYACGMLSKKSYENLKNKFKFGG